MRTQTHSPMPCASPSRDCATAPANPGASPPWPASSPASTLHRARGVRERTVDRAPGLAVRLKLTLSYAGFLMVAGAALLVVAWVVLLRDLPNVGALPGGVVLVRSVLERNLAATAGVVLVFLLVFGLLGGWLLAGRMFAPLTRIMDATRIPPTG